MSPAASRDGSAPIVRAMAGTRALEGTPAKAVRELAGSGRERHYGKGTYLFHQGDDAGEVFFLHAGRVEISSVSSTGHRQLHTMLDPPQFFGELGVLSGSERTTSALAVDDSTVVVIPGAQFLRFLGAQPTASLGLLRALARQVEAHESLVDDLLYLDLKGRVAKRLLGLVSPRFEDLPAAGAVVPAIVTHADLANLAGGSRENVTRILSDFQKRGIVGRTGKRYVLKDVKALRRFAGI